ncbi:MAG: helix-turn-helix transcriptional regulator [Clostridia bacterium]|nr:helix-turn-helix transcriptional regulator [Clostridia bacterium]
MNYEIDYEEAFANRLSQLRINKGVSARDMSLSIGLAPGYINSIENKKSAPSIKVFYYICEYLDITPQEFFDFDNKNPQKLDEIIPYLKRLDNEQLQNITSIVKGLIK